MELASSHINIDEGLNKIKMHLACTLLLFPFLAPIISRELPVSHETNNKQYPRLLKMSQTVKESIR